MPIYAYRCDACGFAKDVLQKVSDPILTVCPHCEKAEFKKQVTAAGFQLKGTGWYATDFKGGSGGTSAPASDKETNDAAASDKPAAATTAESKTSTDSTTPSNGTTKSE